MFVLNTNHVENFDKTVSYKIRDDFTIEFRSTGQLNIVYGTSSISLNKADTKTLLEVLKMELEKAPEIAYRSKGPELNFRSGTDLPDADGSVTLC